MSEHANRIAELVQDLEQELHQVDSLSEDSQKALREAIDEIQTALKAQPSEGSEPPEGTQASDPSKSLNDVINEFEASHPALANAVSRLINALGQMGI